MGQFVSYEVNKAFGNNIVTNITNIFDNKLRNDSCNQIHPSQIFADKAAKPFKLTVMKHSSLLDQLVNSNDNEVTMQDLFSLIHSP